MPDAMTPAVVSPTATVVTPAVQSTAPATPAKPAEVVVTPAATPAATPPATPPAEPKRSVAGQFAKLTRQEKELRTRDAEIKKRAAEIEAREKTAAEKLAQAEAATARLASAKEDPLGALDALGLSFEDVATAVTSGKKPIDPATKVAKELEKIKADLAAKEERETKAKADAEAKAAKDSAEQTAAAEAKAIADWSAGVKGQLSKEPDRFALINKFGFQEFVVSEVRRRSEEKGELVSELEVADALEKQLRAEVQDAVKMDWAKPAVAASTPAPTPVGDPPAEPTPQADPPPAATTPRERAIALARAQAQEKLGVRPSLSDPNLRPSSAGPEGQKTFAEARANAIRLAKERARAKTA